MRSKRYLLSILLLIFLVGLTGCSKTKDPKESFNSFTAILLNKDYTSMYKLLSSETKKNVEEKYFIDTYTYAYKNAKVSKITINPKYPEKLTEDKNGNVSFPADISLETPMGTIQFTYNVTLSKEMQGKEEVWTVNWDEKMILPELEKGDSVKFTKKLGKRGEIRDKNGLPLAVNSTAVNVYAIPEKIEDDRANVVAKLSEALGTTAEEIEIKLNEPYVKSHPDQRVPIMTLSRDYDIERARTAIKVHESITAPPEPTTIRFYPSREAAAQLIGYTDNITEEELKTYRAQGYDEADIIGKTGLESIYEKRLRGEVGGSIYISDSKNNKKKVLIEKVAKDGENITLSIDSRLQNAMYTQLAGDKGTAVAIEPKTGQVLAMVSSPSYNPNILVSEISNKYYLSLEGSADKPLISRFANAIVPGSAFKPVTAAIGLSSGKLDQNKELTISGKQWQNDSSWGSYNVTRVHDDISSVNLKNAFVFSDNIYFARTALSIGKEDFLKGSKDFGIGDKIEFPFPMAASQIGKLDKNESIADTGYGQGEVLMNPLHLALIYGSFANDGNILSPILDLKDKEAGPKIWKKDVISKEITDIIVKDLIQVVEDPKGTGHDAQIPGVSIAGKTGTAELKATQGIEGKENGWFAAFNTEDPKIAVVMMIEEVQDRGESKYVVPKVRNVLASYLKK